MSPFKLIPTLATTLFAGILLSSAAEAASSAASSASDSASDSVGASSRSITQSSNSSSGDRKTAAGDYKVIEMAEVEGRPGMLKLRLQAAGDEKTEFFLTLPRQAALSGHVAEGGMVRANERPYGIEFAAVADNKAFFLVVDDDWHKELQSRPVTL